MGMSEDKSYRRRLGAMLFADVEGYTRLMAEHELDTYDALKVLFARLDTLCAEFEGQVIEIQGDGMLALFDSATNAVRYAVELHKTVEQGSINVPNGQAIRFRIGVHLGEVLVDERGIHGDSVNIAARLQSLAEPGRVLISAAVYEQIRSRLPFGYEFLGPQTLKHVPEPVPVYCVRGEIEGALKVPSIRLQQSAERLRLPDTPSVAVLPFETPGGQDADGWFADGLTEDIILNLSKFKNLFVIARNSAFFFKAKELPPQQAARDLGVQFIVRGSVRRAGGRVRIGVELIEAESGRTIWGERYDRDLDDIFAVQDEVTETIVAATAVVIEGEERKRLSQALPSSLAAYGYVLQGQQHIFKYTRRENHEAHTLYEKALQADPDYARAWAALSRTVNLNWRYSWADKSEGALDTALDYAQSAVKLDPTDARGFGELGFVHLWRKEHDASIGFYKRALSLNPNDADLMSDMADALAFVGQPTEAVTLLERATRLNPFYPDEYLWNLASAYYDLKDYDKAIETVLKMNNQTEGRRVLAASYAQLGRMEDARREAARHKEAHPEFSLERWSKVVPDRVEAQAQHFYEGLKKAGF